MTCSSTKPITFYAVIYTPINNEIYTWLSSCNDTEKGKIETINSIKERCGWIFDNKPVSFESLQVFEIEGNKCQPSKFFEKWLEDNLETVISEKFQLHLDREIRREEKLRAEKYEDYLKLKALFEGDSK
jgi:hypothetical protein